MSARFTSSIMIKGDTALITPCEAIKAMELMHLVNGFEKEVIVNGLGRLTICNILTYGIRWVHDSEISENRYDEFTYYCASRSLEFYSMNPNAWIIRGKSLERMIQDYLMRNGNVLDDYAAYLIHLMDETKWQFDHTYMTEETEEIRKRRKQQAIEAQKIQEKSLSK